MALSRLLANTPRAAARCEIDDLAGHVSLEDIFRHLPPYDRLLTSEVCKRWLSISRKAWLDIIHLDLSSIPGPNIAAVVKQCPNLRTVFAKDKAFGLNELRILSRIPLDSVTLCNCSSFIMARGSFAEETLVGAFSSDLRNALWRELNLRDFQIILRGHLESLPVCSPASLPAALRCLEFRDLTVTCEDKPYLPASASALAGLGLLRQLEGLILSKFVPGSVFKSPIAAALRGRRIFNEIGALRNLRELYLGTRSAFVPLLKPLFELPKLEVLFLHEMEFGRLSYAPQIDNDVGWLKKLASEHAALRILLLKGCPFEEQEFELSPRLRYPNGLGSSPAPLLRVFLDKGMSEKIRFPTPFDSAIVYTFNEPLAQFLEREEIKPIFKGVWIAEKIKEAAKIDVMRT